MSSRRGVLLLVVAIVAVGTMALIAAYSLRRPLRAAGDGRVLVFDVPSAIEEDPPPYSPWSLGALRADRHTLTDLTTALHEAADDDDIHGLILHIDGLDWGWARIAEFRDAVDAFRESGKPVLATLSGGGEPEYLLASAADRIAMPAIGHLQLDGLTASAMFLRGAYDKLGIRPNFAHVGQFKSAVEQYTRDSMSEPARAALDTLLGDQYARLADSLASARGFTGDAMRALIDEGPFLTTEAQRLGLIDTLLDQAAADSLLLSPAGRRYESYSFQRYVDSRSDPAVGEHIALVVASGAIVPGKSRESAFEGREMGSETVIAALREARTRSSVKAVVLRVDSPGGSADASDDIWQEVRRVRAVKPVIVSMSDYAASGGYYIACGADVIVAQPSTLTGSIGIFGGKLNILGLYQKLGLNIETVSRGRHAQMLSPFRDFTPEEAARYQTQLEDFYQVFLSRVALGRGMTTSAVDSIAQGHVWSGAMAKQLGLVDELGGLDKALSIARSRAKISQEASVILEVYPRPKRPYLQRWLSQMLGDEDDTAESRLPLGLASNVLRSWMVAAHFPNGAALALMPYSITIR